jgi:tRNA/rRNA methyltransferase
MAAGEGSVWRAPRFAPATHDDLESLHAHAERTLADMRFLDRRRPRLLMPRLRRLFGRAALEREEVNILRGILARIDDLIARARR